MFLYNFKISQRKNLKYLDNFFQIWKLLHKRRKYQVLFLFIFTFFSGFAEIFSLATVIPFLTVLSNPQNLFKINFISNICNLLGIAKPLDLILFVTLLFCIAVILSSIIKIFNIWLASRISALIAIDLSKRCYKNILNQNYIYFSENNSSKLLNTITINITRTLTAIYSFMQLLSDLIITFCLSFSLLFFNFRVGLILGFSLTILYIIAGNLTKKRLSKNSKYITLSERSQIKSIQEGLGLIRDIIIDQSQETFLNYFSASDKKIKFKLAENNFLPLIPRYLIEGIAISLFGLVALSLSFANGFDEKNILILGTFALGAQRLLPSIHRVYTSWSSISANIFAIESVLELLFLKNRNINFKDKNKKYKFEFHEKIELKSVYFSYLKNDIYALKNINLLIPKAKRIAILGRNGSGKSTLSDILLGLLKPSKGELKIDSKIIDFSKIEINEWRSIVAHVPQSIYIADSSFIENIAIGIPSELINKQRVIEAAKKAKLHDFILSRRFGYDEILGEEGVKLSGGQRQKIAIARAFYKNSKVIIFDEATSAIDKNAEDSLMSSLSLISKDITIIMITHKLNLIKDFDYVYKLRGGEIVFSGTPSEMKTS